MQTTNPTNTELELNAHNKDEYAPAHTAEHLLNQTMVRMFGCERSRNAHIERRKSKINWHLNAEPTSEEVTALSDRMGELIAANLPVTTELADREHLPEGVKLNRLPQDASETLRLVRIGDYDICPCLGNHVASTGEIVGFRITSTSWTPADEGGVFRVVYRTE